MPYWADQRSLNSWPFHITHTSSSRCQDPRGSSKSMTAFSNQKNAIGIYIKYPTPLEHNRNSEIAMVIDRSVFPLASHSELKEITPDFSVDSDTTTHQVHPTDPNKTVRIYAHLPKEQASALLKFLQEEWSIFAWCPAYTPGVPREFAEHTLQIYPNTKPVKQALCRFSKPKRRAIGEEVNTLLDAKSSDK